jgi:hypothetical protein
MRRAPPRRAGRLLLLQTELAPNEPMSAMLTLFDDDRFRMSPSIGTNPERVLSVLEEALPTIAPEMAGTAVRRPFADGEVVRAHRVDESVEVEDGATFTSGDSSPTTGTPCRIRRSSPCRALDPLGDIPNALLPTSTRSSRCRGSARRAAVDAAAERNTMEGYAFPSPVISYPPELPVSAARRDRARHRGPSGRDRGWRDRVGQDDAAAEDLLELGRTKIAHTQPRRIAARTIAERIAEELQVPLGGAVGYKVRFTDQVSEDTQIALVTDGILLNEIHRDRLLRRYDTIIIDEAHERSLNIDFLLGYLARILPERPDLKLVITSATIDPESFASTSRMPRAHPRRSSRSPGAPTRSRSAPDPRPRASRRTRPPRATSRP